jgi:hypothetical protein
MDIPGSGSLQENQRSSLKAVGAGVSAMQEQQAADHGRLSVLQAHVLNLTQVSVVRRPPRIGTVHCGSCRDQ